MTIDGKNIKQEYGCMLIWEGNTSVPYNLSAILKYPTRTKVEYRNWAEMDGIDPDVSEFNVEPKKVQLQFLMEAGSLEQFWLQYRKLIADITSPQAHIFDLGDFGVHSYRYDVNSAYTHPQPFNEGRNLSVFSIDFIENKPVIGNSAIPYSDSAPHGQFAINGYDLGDFGMHVDDGTDDLLKYPSAKKPFSDGREVDFSTIRMQHKELRLSIWQLAQSKAEFLNNHAAFWNQFARTGLTDLYINVLGGSTEIYYTDCSSYTLEAWSDNLCAARFTISIVVPVVTWADGGGSIFVYGLWDNDFGFICDEDSSILVLG